VQDVITQLRKQVNSAELQRQRVEQKYVLTYSLSVIVSSPVSVQL